MGTFRKSLKLGKKSRQIEENLKKLDKELEKTGALDETAKTPAAPQEEQPRKFDWRREFSLRRISMKWSISSTKSVSKN